jgi:probable F420-dependent oxidoreductase
MSVHTEISPTEAADRPTIRELRPFRFGVQLRGAESRREWVGMARAAEDLGYDSLTLPDHFDHQLGPIAGLMAAADATSRIRLGHLVLCNDHHHPLALAKELATLDLLSEGRLDIAVGAGHDKAEYLRAGIAFDVPSVRIARLAEALDVILGLMGPHPFSYQGQYYRINNLDGMPKPFQKPPRVFIGGGGPRMLDVCAKYGDVIGINGTVTPGPVPSAVWTSELRIPAISQDSWKTMTKSSFAEKVAYVRQKAGDRADDIEFSVRAFITKVTPDRDAIMDQLSRELELDRHILDDSPFVVVGPVEQIVADLTTRRAELGVSHVVVGAAEMHEFAPVVAALAD